jgi:dipeptidyl aminopeptidase/acylaminoacyl peptidase
MRLRFLPTAAFLVVSICGGMLAAQSKRPITETDLFQFMWIGDPQVSPDGSRVVFVRVSVNAKKDGYDSALFVAATTGDEPPRRLTTGPHDSSPQWSPDGSSLAFVRAIEQDGKRLPPQLFLLSMRGGEPLQLTDLPKGAAGPKWSPDGTHIGFKTETSQRDLETRQARERCASGGCTDETTRESDMRTITRAVYRSNDSGYLDPTHPSHVWVVDAPTPSQDRPAPRQVTQGAWEDDEFVWSIDGRQIYFTRSHLQEPSYEMPRSDLFAVNISGSDAQLLNALNLNVARMALSPDGRRLAFVSSVNEPVRSYSQPDLWTVALTPNARPRNLTTSFDYDVADGVGGDNAPPRAAGSSPVLWSHDGRSIITVAAREGSANLYRFDAESGVAREITNGKHAVQSYRSSDGGRRIVALISTPVEIGDLFSIGDGEPRRLTHVNSALFSQLNLTMPEEIWYTSFDGRKIQAWVQRPADFQPGRKYPLILDIHGGPHSAYGWVFDHEFQWFAANGYLVLYPNPRGSTSYGQEFGNIIQYKYPGDDYRDLMAGVDELIKRGWADPDQLGVTGGSGGGVLTNWTVTQTDRFKAAVSQRDISNWASWWYTADFTLFQPEWFRQPPFRDPQEYASRSAITSVEKIRTPIAFILGEADWRTPPESGGEQLFRALKFLKRPTAMVRFPNETHELSRSGEPWHRIERLRAILGWMDKYIRGKDVAQFRDVLN